MIDVRNNFSTGLNLDDAPIQVRKTSYTDALNITRDAIEGSADNIITNVVGNRIVSYNAYPSGNGKYIGFYANTLRNTIIGFRWNENGFHQVLEFNKTTRTIIPIFTNLTDSDNVDILGFTENDKITSINVLNREEGDLLFFLDSLGRPTKMDITLFKAGTYTPVTREIINVAVTWPPVPITCVYNNDTTKTVNGLLNKLFKFQYVFQFDDLTESVGSPVSATPLPSNILNPTFTQVVTNNNVINLSISSGGKNVKAIKLLMSYAEKQDVWKDFVLVDTIDKGKQGIADDVIFNYNFFNDSTYPLYDLERRIQLMDFVPIFAKSQEMPNGNVLAYGAITEGYDNDITPNVTLTIDTIAVGNGGVIGNLSETHSVITVILTQRRLQEVFAGSPSTGTVITIRVNSDTVVLATYTTLAGDTTQEVVNGLAASATGLGVATPLVINSTTINFFYTDPPYTFSSTTIAAPAVTASVNSVCTWPFLSQRNIGIAYFDQQGRTNGVLYNAQVIFPAYAENGSQQVLVPFINAKIFHRPPLFAHSFSWMITKDDAPYLYFISESVNDLESEYLYFNITDLGVTQKKNPTVANVVSWTAQDADRFRLIKRVSDGHVFGTNYNSAIEGIVVSPTINGTVQTDKTFIKIRKVAPFSTENYSSNLFVFQLYRPQQPQANALNLPFFEFGETYPILLPGTSNRSHGGQVTNQSANLATPAEFNFYNGDAYVRPRVAYTQGLASTGVSTFFVEDRNFVDYYISAVNSLDGRSNAIDPNARQAYYPALIRFGGEYQINTNINKTNQFKAEDFDEYDYSYGAIQRMKVRARFMRVFQELKTGVVPLFSKIGKNATGDEITIVTDSLLNPIQYYDKDFGIGTAVESLASFNYADYFCDNNKGAIIRVSLNGIEVISVLYKVNSWAVEHIPLRTGNSKIYGGFDQKLNNYICALEAATFNNAPSCKLYRIFNNTLTPKAYTYTDCDNNPQSGILPPTETGITFCALLGSVGGIDIGSEILGSCSPDTTDPAVTLAFDEDNSSGEGGAFESFLSWNPEMISTIGTLLVSAKDGEIYTHDNPLYNTFYGAAYDSTITFVFNENSLVKKTWITVNQIASGTWDCPEISTNSYVHGTTIQQSNLVTAEFTQLEGNPSASIKRASNSRNGKISGDIIKGNYSIIKFRQQQPTDLVNLSLVSVGYLNSPTTTT